MSWQAYVDSSLIGSGNVDMAAIWSIEGDSAWAQSSNFVLSPADVKAIIGLYQNTDKAFGEGIRIKGQKYFTIKADGDSLYGAKGTGSGAKEGVIIVKTAKCILITHHPESVPSSNCANTVESLAKYLRDAKY